MNIQDRIKEMNEYGFTQEEIAKELNIAEVMVKSALLADIPSVNDKRADSYQRIHKNSIVRHYAIDKEMLMYEILYEHGYAKLNKYLKTYDTTATAVLLNVPHQAVYSLKRYFGYHEKIPPDAIERITYWSNDLRAEAKELYDSTCIRCDKKLDTNTIRFHKINHPGPMNMDNCAVMCNYCRKRMISHIKTDYTVFHGMDNTQFKQWITENDAFVHRNRVYTKQSR